MGHGIDSSFVSTSAVQAKMMLRYNGYDFDDCFIIEYSSGGSGSLYVDVFEKSTLKHIVEEEGASNYDLENQLILFEADCMMIYDAKRKVFHRVEEANDPCYGGMGTRFYWKIERVTNRYIYLSHVCDEEVGVKGIVRLIVFFASSIVPTIFLSPSPRSKAVILASELSATLAVTVYLLVVPSSAVTTYSTGLLRLTSVPDLGFTLACLEMLTSGLILVRSEPKGNSMSIVFAFSSMVPTTCPALN